MEIRLVVLKSLIDFLFIGLVKTEQFPQDMLAKSKQQSVEQWCLDRNDNPLRKGKKTSGFAKRVLRIYHHKIGKNGPESGVFYIQVQQIPPLAKFC